MRKVIYDIGANLGDNIPYYLLKAHLVVAIEANPVLCEGIASRFREEIESGKLVLVDSVITTKAESEPVFFYLHKKRGKLSQFPEPHPDVAQNFEKVLLPGSVPFCVET